MKQILLGLLAALLLSTACGGDSEDVDAPTQAPASPSRTTPSGGTAAPTATPAAAALTDLSLVYFDRSKGQGAELYIAAFDGGTPKKLTTIANPARPLDVRGKVLAVAESNAIRFYDLTTAQARAASTTGQVLDGHFVDNTTFVYTMSTSGCAGPGGGARSSLMRVDLNTMMQRELVALPNNLAIAGVDVTSGAVAVVPRGCDPAVQLITIYSANDGKELQRAATPGCGWVAVSIAQKKALVSWKSCSPLPASGAQANLYDFSTTPPTSKDIIGPSGGLNAQRLLFRPGANEAVFGTTSSSGSGPGSVTGTGIWQIDFATSSVSVLVPGEGLEQYPVAWSPDGRYLMAASVQAQGMCSYSYADATNRAVKPIARDITYCGVNGEIVGWTSLK